MKEHFLVTNHASSSDKIFSGFMVEGFIPQLPMLMARETTPFGWAIHLSGSRCHSCNLRSQCSSLFLQPEEVLSRIDTFCCDLLKKKKKSCVVQLILMLCCYCRVLQDAMGAVTWGCGSLGLAMQVIWARARPGAWLWWALVADAPCFPGYSTDAVSLNLWASFL